MKICDNDVHNTLHGVFMQYFEKLPGNEIPFFPSVNLVLVRLLLHLVCVCGLVGLRFGEELGSDDAHHHRHGGRSDHQAGLEPRGGRRQPAVWGGALLPERLSRLPQR